MSEIGDVFQRPNPEQSDKHKQEIEALGRAADNVKCLYADQMRKLRGYLIVRPPSQYMIKKYGMDAAYRRVMERAIDSFKKKLATP